MLRKIIERLKRAGEAELNREERSFEIESDVICAAVYCPIYAKPSDVPSLRFGRALSALVLACFFCMIASASYAQDCPLTGSFYLVKAGKVYFHAVSDVHPGNEDVELPKLDLKNFHSILIPNSKKPKCNVHFAKDGKKVFFDGREIESADPKSFQALTNNWGRDRLNLFYKEIIVPNADTSSVKIIHGKAVDKNYIFEFGQTVCKFHDNDLSNVPICDLEK